MPTTTPADARDEAARPLFRLGGAAAVTAAFLTVAEVVVFSLYPQPSTVSGWFDLFHRHPLAGLVSFWGLELPLYAMFVLVFLALYRLLRRVHQAAMAVALALVLVACATFYATNNPFSMLSLSSRHAAAALPADRSALLAAGEAVLAGTNQRAVGGFNLALFLVSVAGVLVSGVMLRAGPFSRSTAYIGMLAFGLSLADYLRQALTTSVAAALLLILPGALCLVLWYWLVGRQLLRLARPARVPTEG